MDRFLHKGTRCFQASRQWNNCDLDVSDYAFGTLGTGDLHDHKITGKNEWRRKPSPVNMYDAEHVALFKSIRSHKPINNGDYMSKSTLMAIMGRMATYTGQLITWDQAMNSSEDLTPAKYEWGPIPTPEIAIPGVTKFA